MSAFDFVRPSKEYKRARFYYRKAWQYKVRALAFAGEALVGEAFGLALLNNSASVMWPQFFKPFGRGFLGPFAAIPNSVAAICCALGASTVLVIAHAMARSALPDLRYANLRYKGAKRGMQKARAKQAMQVAPQG